MKTEQFQKIAKTEDFWWYYIAQLEAGRMDWADAVISYRDNFANRGLLFKNSPQETE